MSDVQPTLTALAVLVPVFMAMGTLMEEHSQRTDETLRKLPLRTEWVFVVKCLAGIVTLVVLLVIGGMVVLSLCYFAAAAGRWIGRQRSGSRYRCWSQSVCIFGRWHACGRNRKLKLR